jgi:hypothetical protein
MVTFAVGHVIVLAPGGPFGAQEEQAPPLQRRRLVGAFRSGFRLGFAFTPHPPGYGVSI